MKNLHLLIASILFIACAIIDIARVDPTPNSIPAINQAIQFYGEMTIGFVCFVGYLILKQLNENK